MDRNPQAKQMADESMVRNLAAQAQAIWPQEEPLVRSYPAPSAVLDVGCGTGEITSRVAGVFPAVQVESLNAVAVQVVPNPPFAGTSTRDVAPEEINEVLIVGVSRPYDTFWR